MTESRSRKTHQAVVVRTVDPAYPREAPFHPGEIFAEYPWRKIAGPSAGNAVYEAVRDVFRMAGLDAKYYGTAKWNPLGGIIKPGDRVVIKPNLVLHYHPLGLGLDSVVTHPSIVRAALDFVCIALRGRGSIVVGDAPLQTCDFDDLTERFGLRAVVDWVARNSGIDVALCDFRKVRSVRDPEGIIREREIIRQDDREHRVVRLDDLSYHRDVAHRAQRYRVTNYVPGDMQRHHNERVHEYLVSRHILEADCVISLPKLKTHRKAGLTAALKNVIGINGSKEWLPHHTMGSRERGGDEYDFSSVRKSLASRLQDRLEAEPRYRVKRLYHVIQRAIAATRHVVDFPDRFTEGSWHGNDTIWRTTLDLNRIVLYGDAAGTVDFARAPRKFFTIVDAIVAGEEEGPLDPTPKPCGVLVAGDAAAAVDTCCAYLMGFDPELIPTVRNAWTDPALGYDPSWELISNGWTSREELRDRHLSFRPSRGWQKYLQK